MKQLLLLILTLLTLTYSVFAQEQSQIQFDTITVKNGYKFKNNYELYLAYQCIYPINDTAPINKIRLKIIRNFFCYGDTLNLSLNDARHHYEKDIINEIANYPRIDTATAWNGHNSDELYSAIRIVNKKVLTFIRKSYWNRGHTAHGGIKVVSTNFDLLTGDIIAIDDLFAENSKPAVLKIMRKNLAEQNIPAGSVNSASLTDNFMILPKGLKFFFDEYEIAPYSYGRIEAIIKYSEFAHLLKPSARQYFYE